MSIYIKIGIALIFFGVVFLILSVIFGNRTKKALEKYPVIDNEAGLREAMIKAPQKYIVYNVPLTGDSCVNILGILKDEYISLQSRKFVYRESARQTDSWLLRETKNYASDRLFVYGDIPLEFKEYEPYNVVLNLSKDIKDEYLVCLYGTNCYYPEDYGDKDGNIRYEFRGIKNGSEVAFMADIGNNKVVLSSLKKGKKPSIAGENSRDSLEFSQDETSGFFSVMGVIAILFGILTFIITGVYAGVKHFLY